jgi:hypothetical protein
VSSRRRSSSPIRFRGLILSLALSESRTFCNLHYYHKTAHRDWRKTKAFYIELGQHGIPIQPSANVSRTSSRRMGWAYVFCLIFFFFFFKSCLSKPKTTIMLYLLYIRCPFISQINFRLICRDNCITGLWGWPKLRITYCDTKSSWRVFVVTYNYNSLLEPVFRPPN